MIPRGPRNDASEQSGLGVCMEWWGLGRMEPPPAQVTWVIPPCFIWEGGVQGTLGLSLFN